MTDKDRGYLSSASYARCFSKAKCTVLQFRSDQDSKAKGTETAFAPVSLIRS